MLSDISDLESGGGTHLGLGGEVPLLDQRRLNRLIPYKEVGAGERIAGRPPGPS